jgi:hypothetical protein
MLVRMGQGKEERNLIQVSRLLKKLKIDLTYNPAIPLLGIYIPMLFNFM